MKKRILCIMLTLCLVLAFMPQTAFATSSSGSCGTNLTWTFDGNETLTISGTGAMPDWRDNASVPWHDNCPFIRTIVVDSGVTSIGDHAFVNCTRLTSVTIPNSVTSIGMGAFFQCTGLTSVTIPNRVTSIKASAFCNCRNLTSITIPSSVTSIGDYAFQYCTGLTSVTIPNSVTSIGQEAFRDCTGLTSITIPDSVTSIGQEAFRDCTSLTSVTIPSGVTSIAVRTFVGCTGLTSVTIPSSVTLIGGNAFEGCTGLTSITIPSSVTSIGACAFLGCTGLTSITIPNSVTDIKNFAFKGCTGLTTIFLPDNNLNISEGAIPNTASQVKYSLDTNKGEVTITGITGGTSVPIPAKICGYSVVAVADNYQTLVGTHTCKGGTATCAARALCDICGKEYGALKEHTYNWQSQDGKYWSKCQYCGYETTKKDIPTITINGVDSVCATQDYEFSFTLPQGVTDATYGCDFGNRGFGGIDPTIENGKMCGVIDASLYGTSEGSFKIIIDAKTADGFDFSVSKTVALNKEHLDSEPKDHLCDICGATVSGHNLEKISAKDATVTETGNKEYWHCKDCGKYFSDENGKSEIIDLATWKAGEGKLEKLPLKIIEGIGQSIAAGEKKELTFRSNADFSDFIRVELDGKTLDAKYYTAKEGSTIITLKADYVASLSAGNHTIGIVSTSGTATAKFTVDAKAAPKTGDNSNLLLWLALIFFSGGMMTVTGGYRKREKHS